MRVVGVLLSVPATWAVWRAGTLVAGDSAGDAATLFFTLSLFGFANFIIVSPDLPLMAASALVLVTMLQVVDTDRGIWWVAVGTALGFACLAKYSGLFLGAGVAMWLAVTTEGRRWLRTPWPWAAAAIAAGAFAPVIYWNAEHGWVSFAKQFSRAVPHAFAPHFLVEFVVVQALECTLGVAVLGGIGVWRFTRARTDRSTIVAALFWPAAAYFLVHSLHSRVEGNWTSLLLPPFTVAAGYAATATLPQPSRRIARLADAIAIPLALATVAAVAVQSLTGIVPLGRSGDPTARVLGSGWPELARALKATRRTSGAPALLTLDYGTTAWIAFYAPGTPVRQVTEPERWIDMPEYYQSPSDAAGIIVCREPCAITKAGHGPHWMGTIARRRGGIAIESYALLRWRF